MGGIMTHGFAKTKKEATVNARKEINRARHQGLTDVRSFIVERIIAEDRVSNGWRPELKWVWYVWIHS